MSWPMRLLGLLARLGLLRGKHPQPSYAHQRQREASTQYNAVDRIGQIRTPTLILHARRDRSMPPAAAQQLHVGIAGSQLEVFRGGHMFFLLSQRAAVIDRIEHFLAA
jgi:pimeloyl-ACP methyl ester carboxylesterase